MNRDREPPYRAAGSVKPSLPAVRMSKLCRESVFGECRRTGCRYSHDITLIESVEADQESKRRVESDITNTLVTAHRVETDKGSVGAFLDGPGALSSRGPRHNNDYQQVGAIAVFPPTDEILSLRRPHLPAKDACLKGRHGGWEVTKQRLAALLYRHLRFDAVEPVIDVAYTSMQMMLLHRVRPTAFGQRYRQETAKGVPFTFLFDVQPEEMQFVEGSGASIELSFACPNELRGIGFAAQGVCEPSMLLCLLMYNRSTKELGSVFLQTEQRLSNTDRADQSRAGIVASLADPCDIPKVRELLYAYKVNGGETTFALADCNGVLPAGFAHHLSRLQYLSSVGDGASLSKSSTLTALLMEASEGNCTVKAPTYSKVKGFLWKLDSIKKDPLQDKEPFILKTDDRPTAIEQIKTRTTLDGGQAEALFCNLTRELAFTQGPPGTGKSYLALATIKVLLQSLAEDYSPILVVAQTNHSLDETLEGLIKGGIVDVARCGTNSQSTLLIEKHSVRVLGNKRKLNGLEKASRKAAQQNKLSRLEAGENLAAAWCNNLSWVNRMANLSIDDKVKAASGKEHPNVGAWSLFANAGRLKEEHPGERHSSKDQKRDDQNKPSSKGSTRRERKAAVREWFTSLTVEEQCDAFAEVHRRYHVALEASRKSFDLIDANTLRKMSVVGMTSTGVAQYSGLLLRLQPKILVIEEASELTEAHTLCAMLPSIEHVIAIGDPRQLRPHIGQRILSMETSNVFRFDESLFERLVTVKYPFAKLEVQRRAHPDLARLIQATDYPFVKSHESTKSREDVRGMDGRMQWMNHNKPEALTAVGEVVSNKSFENPFEAYYIFALALKFVRFDRYWIGDITILTPYNGQLALISKLLSEVKIHSILTAQDRELLRAKGAISRGDLGSEEELDQKISRGEEIEIPLSCIVHAATIDNYQGEEARIIIFSAVRSNRERSIGFLGNENRINVAISRAREGFYVIGDAALLRAKSPFWERVIDVFRRKGRIHSGLHVRCDKHSGCWIAREARDDAFACRRCLEEERKAMNKSKGSGDKKISGYTKNKDKGREKDVKIKEEARVEDKGESKVDVKTNENDKPMNE